MPIDVMDTQVRAKRDVTDKIAILQRLARIEGQVRGLRQMAESNRGTTDQLQQVNAVIAALREVALLSISQEIKTQVMTMSGAASRSAWCERRRPWRARSREQWSAREARRHDGRGVARPGAVGSCGGLP